MKHKNFSIITAILATVILTVSQSNAQIIESFAPVGAKWYYGMNGGYFAPEVDWYQTFEVTKDTVIAEKQCSVLEIKGYSLQNSSGTVAHCEYLHQEQQKVFLWNKYYQRFELLYDFSAKAGDTLEILQGGTVMRVDLVDTVTISGVQLRRQYLSDINGSLIGFSPSGTISTVTERIGGNGYLFPSDFGASDGEIPSFRCYDDSEISLHLMQCDYITSNILTETVREVFNLTITDNFVRLPIANVKTDFYSISGQTVMSVVADFEGKISVETLTKGIYFVRLHIENQKNKTYKVMKL